MKKLFSEIVVFILCVASLAVFSACGKKNNVKTPQEVIKDAYGDAEYKISFSSEGLDEPLGDLAYTAKSIPVLPSPQKVGYIFGGWFFDKEYHTQYQDNLLLMTMGDVTLYAKWIKEDMTVSGTYDVDFEAEILEDTIKEGQTAKKFGGYKKFPESISVENTYIEKSDNDLLLKIEYDCIDPEPYGALADSYKVTVNAVRNPSSVYIKESVNSLSDTVKTIYIRITDADLSVPVYLDIETTNWHAEGLSDEERYGTTTTYTVEFKITRLIGFKTPYVDTSVPLEDGYYLVRSYFKTIENKSSMGDGFNSVFSYLKAENGKYKLIKPFTPYAGLVQFTLGKLEEPYYKNLFYRMMSFMPNQYCFELDTTGFDGEVESNYMDEYSWFTVSLEFSYFGNKFNSNYIYGVGFSGEKTTDMLKYNSYFSNTLYTMSIPRLYSDEGNEIATSYVAVQHRIGGKTDNSFYANRTYTLSKGEYEYSLKFNEAGEFYVGFRFLINGTSYSFGQVVEVLSDNCDVTITFVTDNEHPFSDGLTERTVKYNLSNNINALNEKEFEGSDILFGWTQYISRDATSRDVVKNGISDFIGRYNSQNVTLYAIWDGGISVTAKSEGNDDRTKHYFRDSSSGYYVIDLSVYKVYAPAGSVLAGWTGGFLGDAVKNGKINLNEVSMDSDYFTINAVYKKLLTVKYSVNTAYSASVIRNDSVIEGNGLESNRTVVAKTGYTFKGWFVQGDENRTLIDLSTYKFAKDAVLVAVFTDSEGNEVW